MKGKVVTIVGGALALVLLTGCATGFMEYQTRTATHNNLNAFSMTRYVSDDYEVLGTVKAIGESQSILGIVVEGKEGQALLMEAAASKFNGECTGIKDISAYKEYKAILPIVFNEVKTTYIGTAVKE